MPLTTAGSNLMTAGITGGTVTAFNATTTHIGVGDGTALFAAGDTDLAGLNKVRKVVNATDGFSVATNVITAKATFGTADANFAWNEWGVFNAATAGTMLNRKVESLGTKPSTQSWVFTATVTVSAA